MTFTHKKLSGVNCIRVERKDQTESSVISGMEAGLTLFSVVYLLNKGEIKTGFMQKKTILISKLFFFVLCC